MEVQSHVKALNEARTNRSPLTQDQLKALRDLITAPNYAEEVSQADQQELQKALHDYVNALESSTENRDQLRAFITDNQLNELHDRLEHLRRSQITAGGPEMQGAGGTVLRTSVEGYRGLLDSIRNPFDRMRQNGPSWGQGIQLGAILGGSVLGFELIRRYWMKGGNWAKTTLKGIVAIFAVGMGLNLMTRGAVEARADETVPERQLTPEETEARLQRWLTEVNRDPNATLQATTNTSINNYISNGGNLLSIQPTFVLDGRYALRITSEVSGDQTRRFLSVGAHRFRLPEGMSSMTMRTQNGMHNIFDLLSPRPTNAEVAYVDQAEFTRILTRLGSGHGTIEQIRYRTTAVTTAALRSNGRIAMTLAPQTPHLGAGPPSSPTTN